MPENIEVSIDELIDARKDISDQDGVIYKAHVSPRSWNEEERSAGFVISAEVEDSYRDIVVQDGIDLEARFNSNPVALFGHRSWDMPIGSWSDVRMVKSSPRRTEAKLTFSPEGIDDVADRTARNVKAGVLKASSIGFMPRAAEKILDEEGNWKYGYRYTKSELYEVSVVTIPAVRQALIRGAGASMEEIVTPEVIEEFMEHLKANPAIAKMINKDLYLEVYREMTGNKLHSIATVDVDCPRPEWLDDLTKAAERLERAAEAPAMITINPDLVTPELLESIRKQGPGNIMLQEPAEPEIDPIHKAAHDAVEKALSEVEPELETLTEDDTERKSTLSALFDRVRSIFAPSEPEKPALAAQETKDALRARLEQIKAANAA